MKIEVKESDRLFFNGDMVEEMKYQNATVELTSKRYNSFMFGEIRINDVRKFKFNDSHCFIYTLRKGNAITTEIAIPNALIDTIDCLGVFWSEFDEE